MEYNLSRYVAFFPDYQLDSGNVLAAPNNVNDIFSPDYPPCPEGVKLQENPEIPNHDKDYSTDNNSIMDNSISFSSSSSDNDIIKGASDDEGKSSYI